MDQELNQVLATDYLSDLADRPVAELRALRAECQAVETKLSYLRRMVQGRHDIISGEIQRQKGGGDPADVSGLVERLPEILSDRIRGPGSGRLPATFEPGEIDGRLVDRLDEIDSAWAAPDPDLDRVAAELAALETELSDLRRSMFDRIDAIEGELTGRYRDGKAQVDDLLTTNGD